MAVLAGYPERTCVEFMGEGDGLLGSVAFGKAVRLGEPAYGQDGGKNRHGRGRQDKAERLVESVHAQPLVKRWPGPETRWLSGNDETVLSDANRSTRILADPWRRGVNPFSLLDPLG